MKKRLLAFSVVVLALLVIFFFSKNKDAGTDSPDPVPLAISKHSDAFTQSFENLLFSYYDLKDALVAADTVKANGAAGKLAQHADSLKLDAIRGDSTGLIKETAKSLAGMINTAALGLMQESGLEEKRKEFESMTDPMWSLTRTIRYDGGKVYYQFCPMAFNDRGAYWLSRDTEIRNPYFGDKMLKCGSVEDSLNYITQ